VQEANSSADQLHDDSGNGMCTPEREHLPCLRPGCGHVRKVDFLHASTRSARASGRLAILTAQEIEALYGLPRFTEEERQLYFDLSPGEQAAVAAVQTAVAAVHVTLQLGYFKASHRFFVYTREVVLPDLDHIRRRYFPHLALDAITMLSKPTRLAQQHVILDLFAYRLCDAAAKAALEQKAQRTAMLPGAAHLPAARDVGDPDQ